MLIAVIQNIATHHGSGAIILYIKTTSPINFNIINSKIAIPNSNSL